MAGKFELYQDNAGKYRFRLKAGNGEIIAVGEAYESKSGAENGIKSVQTQRTVGDGRRSHLTGPATMAAA